MKSTKHAERSIIKKQFNSSNTNNSTEEGNNDDVDIDLSDVKRFSEGTLSLT